MKSWSSVSQPLIYKVNKAHWEKGNSYITHETQPGKEEILKHVKLQRSMRQQKETLKPKEN